MIRLETHPDYKEGLYMRCDRCLNQEIRLGSRFDDAKTIERRIKDLDVDGWHQTPTQFGKGPEETHCPWCSAAFDAISGRWTRQTEIHERYTQKFIEDICNQARTTKERAYWLGQLKDIPEGS